ncbi:MAG TPA: DUF6489 family protein [Alphaproteobacteria bacterium]|nr:DUF6489 family protein [Alphaproteobacteria bacterium]
MKITIDIDCTPQEARSFLGLPDLEPLQTALLSDVEARMRAALASMDPDALMKLWFPGGMQGWEQLQKMFWAQVAGGGGAEHKGKEERKGKEK